MSQIPKPILVFVACALGAVALGGLVAGVTTSLGRHQGFASDDAPVAAASGNAVADAQTFDPNAPPPPMPVPVLTPEEEAAKKAADEAKKAADEAKRIADAKAKAADEAAALAAQPPQINLPPPGQPSSIEGPPPPTSPEQNGPGLY